MNFFRDFGIPELLIILVIIILLFGPGRIGKIAGEMGKGIKAFKDGMQGASKDETTGTKTESKDNITEQSK